jgi:hypothetical protein
MNTRYHLNRILLGVATAISFAMFWFVGSWFNIPINRGFNASLLTQPSGFTTMVIVALTILVSIVVCTIVAGSVRSDAGLFCTALGLMALSIRGGPMRYTLFDAKSSLFFTLAIELLVLFAIFGAGWQIVVMMRAMGLSKQADPHFKPNEEDFSQKLIATAIQAVATLALMSILCRTDQKAQALASVGVASMLGSIVAVMVAPTRPSIWYWPGPLLVGLLGYFWASFSPEKLSIGQPAGYFAALSRALPLDYASAGIAGAMLGYWFGRAWTSEQEEVESESTANAVTQ